jgi:hypothetical protein
MASYDASPAYQFWLAVERPVIVNQVAYYNDRVGFPNTVAVLARDPHMTLARLDAAWLHDARALNRARSYLALGDRMHALHRLTQTVRVTTRTLPLALVFALEVWLAELETVAAQHAALGPIGPDPGPGPFLAGLPVFGPFLPR